MGGEAVHNQQRLVDMNLPDAEAAAIARIAREQGVDFMTAMSIFGERFDRLGR